MWVSLFIQRRVKPLASEKRDMSASLLGGEMGGIVLLASFVHLCYPLHSKSGPRFRIYRGTHGKSGLWRGSKTNVVHVRKATWHLL